MSTLLDPEAVELLSAEPELLALADALVSSKPRRHRRLPLAAGAAVAVTIALTLLAPWSGGAPTLARALAAIGPRPIVHIVVRAPLQGVPGSAETQTETWYDTVHRLMHTIVRRNGQVVDDYVWRYFSPTRSSRIAGFVAARGHRLWFTPGAALTTLPTPELADFVTRYRNDLATGRARIVGRARIGGHDVVWLEFPRRIWTIEIAVDAQTYKPALLRVLVGGKLRGPDAQIVVAETLPLGAGNFRAPRHPGRTR
jgi:hypothetical protein